MAQTPQYVRSTSFTGSTIDEAITAINLIVDELDRFRTEWNLKQGGGTITLGQALAYRLYGIDVPGTPVTPTSDIAPATITIVSGNSQSATVNTQLTNPLVVIVKNAAGIALTGAPVSWATTGNGRITADIVTDAAGHASASFVTDTGAGDQTVTATIPNGQSVSFTATGTADAAATIEVTVGYPLLTAPVSTALPSGSKPAVLITDQYGNPKSGTTVTFAVTAGGGSGTSLTRVSNASGEAVVGSWTMGATPITNTMTATAAGLSGSPVTFTVGATGSGGAVASRMTFDSGGTQAGVTAGAAATAIVVKVDDGAATAIQGVIVTGVVRTGGGSLGAATATTDASGLASFTLTTGTTVGSNTVEFSAIGATGSPLTNSPLTATVDTVAGAANKWVIAQQPSSNAQTGVAFAIQPTLQVADANGNATATSGVTCTAAKASGAGTIGGTLTAVTNAAGLATFTNLSFTGAGSTNTIQFSGTYTAATSANVIIATPLPTQTAFSGALSSVNSGQTIPAFTVYIEDAFNVIVPTATNTVTLTVSAGGTLGGTVSVAAVAGIATFSAATLTGAVGTYTLTATVGGLTPATASIAVVSTSALWPNEPAGCAVPAGLTNGLDFSAATSVWTTAGNWSYQNGATYVIPTTTLGVAGMAPGLPPKSPNNFALIKTPYHGTSGNGSGQGYLTTNIQSLAWRTMYWSAWFWVSPNWYGESTGVYKMYCPLTNSANVTNRIIVSPHGAGTAALRLKVAFQFGSFSGTINGVSVGVSTQYYAPATGTGAITRGQWYRVEGVVVGNTAGQTNGAMDLWMNGLKTHTFTNCAFDSAAVIWKNMNIQSVYGGPTVTNAVPDDQYVAHDHLYISGKA